MRNISEVHFFIFCFGCIAFVIIVYVFIFSGKVFPELPVVSQRCVKWLLWFSFMEFIRDDDCDTRAGKLSSDAAFLLLLLCFFQATGMELNLSKNGISCGEPGMTRSLHCVIFTYTWCDATYRTRSCHFKGFVLRNLSIWRNIRNVALCVLRTSASSALWTQHVSRWINAHGTDTLIRGYIS